MQHWVSIGVRDVGEGGGTVPPPPPPPKKKSSDIRAEFRHFFGDFPPPPPHPFLLLAWQKMLSGILGACIYPLYADTGIEDKCLARGKKTHATPTPPPPPFPAGNELPRTPIWGILCIIEHNSISRDFCMSGKMTDDVD